MPIGKNAEGEWAGSPFAEPARSAPRDMEKSSVSKVRNMGGVTIDDAIDQLNNLRQHARLGGKALLVLSLTGSGIEVVAVDSLVLVNDADGSVVEVRAHLP